MRKEVSEVYFTKSNKNFEKLWEYLDFKPKVPIAIKTHFGEKGNVTYPDPRLVRFFAKKMEKSVLIETTNRSDGLRGKASTHKKLAREHGFDFAPIDICDGEKGNKEEKVRVNSRYTKTAIIGKNVKKYKSILVISHFKGHSFTGFGGVFKNIGVGLASKAGKGDIHSAKSSKEGQEKIVDYVKVILKNKKSAFVNFLVNITKECDCCGNKMKSVMKDIGYLASKDPVALEQASYDLCKKQAGKDIFKKMHKVDGTHQIKYAEKIGLGKRKYKLIDVDRKL